MQRLDEEINELKLEIENPIILAQELIELLLNYLGELKKNMFRKEVSKVLKKKSISLKA